MKETEIGAGFIGFITLGIWLLLRPMIYQLSAPGCLALDAIVVWCSAPTILGFCSELLLYIGLKSPAATQKLCYRAGLFCTKIAVLIDQFNLMVPGNAFAYHANSRKVLVGSFYSVLEQKAKAKAKKHFNNLVKALKADKDPGALKDLATCLMLLSEIVHSEGNYKEAKSLAEQSLEILKKTAPNKTSEGAMLTDLCATYMKQGLIEESISIGRSAVECFDMTDDGLNQLQAIAYNNLSLAYCEAGQYREALDSSRRSLKLKLAASANKPNLSVAIAHVNIADHLLFLERYQDALVEAKAALEILDTQGFGDSMIKATTWQNLGHSHLGLGQLEEAKKYLLMGAASKSKLMPAKDPEWAQLNLDLARLHAALGEKSLADSHFGKAVDIGEKLLGSKHPKLAYIYRQYAKYLEQTHRESQAEVLRAKANEIDEYRTKQKVGK